MGSYSELYLGPFYLGGEKREINPYVMMLFRESDKRVLTVTADSDEAEKYVDPDYLDEVEEVTVLVYACGASAVRDRLELMGVTLDTARAAFESAREHEIETHRHWELEWASGLEMLKEQTAVLESMTVEVWLEKLAEIRRRNLKPTVRTDGDCRDYDRVLRYMLCDHGLEWYGYPGIDIRHVIRLGLETCGPNDELLYDLTHLYYAGEYDAVDDIVRDASYLLQADFLRTQQVVVLTEGSTDKWILERSLALLYPHLHEYFSFMDFDGARVAGGAGSLANIVKAFVGAGILNRIVAVFDNDTAGTVALETLHDIGLPDHIVAMQYPDLELARFYPTIGPAGPADMDVNGLAASIEMYLGEDVLRENGALAPVQWRGYVDRLGQYQGELLHKRVLQQRFKAKVCACEENKQFIDDHDWTGLRAIHKKIQAAFHEHDASELIAAEAWRE